MKFCNSSFKNASFFFFLSGVDNVQYSEASPEECARRLEEDEVQVALLATAECITHDYRVLPFGIAANGEVGSVCLLTNSTSEIHTIYVDSRSRSSVRLLKILISKFQSKVDTQFSDRLVYKVVGIDDLGDIPSGDGIAILLIGSDCLAQKSKYSVIIDLATWWKAATGLPFVFAIIGYKDTLNSDVVAKAEALLEGIFSSSTNHIRDLEEDTKNIYYRLSASELEAVDLFASCILEVSNISPRQGSYVIAATQNQSPFIGRSVDDILCDVASGKRISFKDGLVLAEQATISELGLAADLRRQSINPTKDVSYIVDRNINYTNVCNIYCSFCAFYSSAKTRKNGYLLSKNEIAEKVHEILPHKGIQILLQGGLNPDLGIEWYEDLFRWFKKEFPSVNLHALSADEVWHISKVSNISLREVFNRLIAAGLGSFPGGGAEILVDRVRTRIARLKTNTSSWLEAHATAHSLGLRSTATLMFGTVETWEDRIIHLERLRALQDTTGGFTAFITWPF